MTLPSTLPAPSYAMGPGGDPAQGPDDKLWNYLQTRPTLPINIPTTAASLKLIGRSCILLGWSLRESTMVSVAGVEFMDGSDGGGAPVAEVNLPLSSSTNQINNDVEIVANNTGAAAPLTAGIGQVAGATSFLSGFAVTGLGATAASVIAVTITGILNGPTTFEMAIPAGVTAMAPQLVVEFARSIPAAAVNTNVIVNVPSFGAGNTFAAVMAHGFQRTIQSVATAGGAAVTQAIPGAGVLMRSGLFMRLISGSLTGCVWVKA